MRPFARASSLSSLSALASSLSAHCLAISACTAT